MRQVSLKKPAKTAYKRKHSSKGYHTRAKGIGTDSLLTYPVQRGDDPHPMCTVERRGKLVRVYSEDLRDLLRCAQILQMNLNNRMTEAQSIGGDVTKVLHYRTRNNMVIKLMGRVIDTVAMTDKSIITPSMFI